MPAPRFGKSLPESQAETENLKLFQAISFDKYFIARTGYTGEDGFEIMLPADDAAEFWHALHAAGVAPAGLGARDTLRLEAGMNLYGQDMDETTNPLESGLGWTVELKSDRDFIGKQALLETPVTKQLIGLILLDRGVLRSHQKVTDAYDDARMKVKLPVADFPRRLNQSIALARLPLKISAGDEVHVWCGTRC